MTTAQPSTLLKFLNTSLEDITENNTTQLPVIIETDIETIVEEDNIDVEESGKTDDEQKIKKYISKNLQNDYDYARKAIKRAIDNQLNNLDELTSVVTELQNPEGYDCLAKYSKQIVENSDKLLLLSERLLKPTVKKESKQVVNVTTQANSGDNANVSADKGNTTINNTTNNNAVFLSTDDLLSMIIKKEQDSKNLSMIENANILSKT